MASVKPPDGIHQETRSGTTREHGVKRIVTPRDTQEERKGEERRPTACPQRRLAVLTRHVGQSGDWGLAADGGVGSVVIVVVEPVG